MSIDERAWLGDAASGVRKERVPHSAAAFAARAHGARPLPVACAKVLTITATDNFDPADVVSVLEADPPMSARVLRVVNSSAFALRTRCSSVRQAATLLGRRGVRSAVLAGAILEMFPGSEGPEWKKLHDHATRVGGLARHLAPEWRLPADEMFTAAFLHDIGMWVLLDLEPQYAAVLRERGFGHEATVDEERGLFGFDHAELGEHMLAAWNIPQPIPRVVGLHHDPAEAYAAHPKLALRVAVLRLANLLAHAIDSGVEPDFDAMAATEPLTYLGLSSASVRERYAFLTGGQPAEAGGESAREPRPADRRAGPRPRQPDEVCARCDGASFGVHCGRCNVRLCDAHTPAPGRVCEECEASFRLRVAGSLLAGAGVTLPVVGAGLACSGVVLGLGHSTLGVVPAVCGILLAVFGTWRRWSERRLFLRESLPIPVPDEPA